MEKLTVALLGGGVVGSEVARTLLADAETLAERVGTRLELTAVAVRDASRERPGIPAELLTDDPETAIRGADIVIELMGGIEPARSLILAALEGGSSVVTANKALLAQSFPELLEAADASGVRLEFEAAVAGAIPIVRPLQASLAGDRVTRVMGIVNGTTNYILDQMAREGWGFAHALRTAQELGYAEADPTADVAGLDAAAKAAIIASLAFQVPVSMDDVHVEGITGVSADMIATAEAQGFTIKLLAICERLEGENPGVSARVYPALVSREHPLAAVSGAFNAVFVEAESAGSLMFYGQGAGGAPTSSAVLGDLVSVARRKVLGGRGQAPAQIRGTGRVLPIADVDTRYQITLEVSDRPGVLLAVAEALAAEGVSVELASQTQFENPQADEPRAKLVIATHTARESALAATVENLAALDAVASVRSVLRIEGS
ncbi:homoserine dehydrogenase [Brevibacterium album]|uniref:homoserine dehydrogenase n=1 Tax=Brevibacterium album TaxID=417948 RepID=UPI0004064AAD|nr:homoserine dehydrogenase [Brevibacterium album]